MLEQCVCPSVRLATQFSVFVKRKVSASSNSFALSKRRDGIGLEFLKFFAHVFSPKTRTLRSRPKLGNYLSQPAFQYCSMVGRHIGEGKTHSESALRVDHFGIGFENAIVPENSQRDQHALGKWI
jgi:hypothetical protein